MNKLNINEQIKAAHCIDGGSKEAAIKVQAVLKNMAMANENTLLLGRNGVDVEDFLKSVKKLVVVAASQPDYKVELRYCETDCVRAPNPNCPYRVAIFKEGTQLCPHYIEEDK